MNYLLCLYSFVQFAYPPHRRFLEDKVQKLQIFEQFIEERMQKVREGECESDEFELEALGWRSSRANGRNGFPVFKTISGRENRQALISSVRLSLNSFF
jgi:hypothetical protein